MFDWWLQKPKTNETHSSRHHVKCTPNLSYQVTNDQKRANERSYSQRLKLGSFLAQVQASAHKKEG